jgi:hypothetical protein
MIAILVIRKAGSAFVMRRYRSIRTRSEFLSWCEDQRVQWSKRKGYSMKFHIKGIPDEQRAEVAEPE